MLIKEVVPVLDDHPLWSRQVLNHPAWFRTRIWAHGFICVEISKSHLWASPVQLVRNNGNTDFSATVLPKISDHFPDPASSPGLRTRSILAGLGGVQRGWRSKLIQLGSSSAHRGAGSRARANLSPPPSAYFYLADAWLESGRPRHRCAAHLGR